MDALYTIQASLHAKIDKAFVNFKKKGANKMYRDGALTRLEALEANYKAFVENHNDIITLEEYDSSHDYVTSGLADIVEESYLDVKAEFKGFLSNLENTRPLAVLPSNPSGNQVIITKNRLPDVKLPNFSGKIEKWAEFRDAFKSMIHKNEEIEPIFKFYYLNEALNEEARSYIKHISVTSDNYITAWNLLIEHYENKRRMINRIISTFLSMNSMKSESYNELKSLKGITLDTLKNLESLGRSLTETGEDIFVFLTVKNFDPKTRKDWEKKLGNSRDPPTIDQLKKFLEDHMATLENIEDSKDPKITNEKKNPPVKSHATEVAPENKRTSCPLCKEFHPLYSCTLFKKKPVSERLELVKKCGVCSICLLAHSKKCRYPRNCFECHKRHNTLLHDPSRNIKDSNPSTDSSPNKNSASTSVDPQNQISSMLAETHSLSTEIGKNLVLLSTAQIRVYNGSGPTVLVRALIDQCSQSSFISESCCQKIGLKRSFAKIRIDGVGDLSTTTSRGSVKFQIASRDGTSDKFQIEALVLSKVSGYKIDKVLKQGHWKYLDGLFLADPSFLDVSQIEVLLGSEVHAQIVQGSIVKGSKDEPIATETKLGWIISGTAGTPDPCNPTFVHCTNNSELYDLISEFWKLEEFQPKKKFLTAEEIFCENHFLNNYSRNEEGRMMVRLPFKENALESLEVELSKSYQIAYRTLLSIERKFGKDPLFKEKYFEFMKEYEDLGHMSVSSQSTTCKDNYFIPHHGVIQGSKKLRTVFNASAKVDGVSLNDLLLPGPNLLPELFDIIIRWRRYRYVFIADIEKMFRQILIDPRDRKYQLILWRAVNGNILSHILNTVTYGMNSSPYLAIKALRQHALDFKMKFPLAYIIVEEETYMDDSTSGGDTIEETKEKQVQLRECLKVGGFPLRKWAANHPELEDWLPQSDLLRGPSLFEAHNSLTILGLSWDPVADNFYFKITLQKFEPSQLTKRMALSMISKLFDPIGWLAPVIIVAKIFMQSLWLLKCDWDDLLPQSYSNRWFEYYDKLTALSELKIPRWISLSKIDQKVEIHGFADASMKAYAAVIYLRIVRESEVVVNLQCAKTRVAPTKTVSVPRLELCAANLLAKLVSRYLLVMPLDNPIVHLWSDSKDVLYYLRDHPSRWNVFIANRVSNIQTLLPQAFWHHVGTKDNPADVASRGIEPDLLTSHTLWLEGPSFLKEFNGPWITVAEDIKNESVLEERKIVLSSTTNDVDLSVLERFSSLKSLTSFTSIYIRFLLGLYGRLSDKNKKKIHLFKLGFIQIDLIGTNVISAEERNMSELLWTYIVQQASYYGEFNALKNNKYLNKSSLIKLHPFIDNDLLRVGGRLRYSLLEYSEKYPLILPRDNHLTILLIREMHLRTMHGSIQLTICNLRIKYWIIKVRQAVKTVISNCTTCIRFNARVQTPIMGNLPKERCTPAYPFERSGVDFAGPFKIRLSKSRGRGTCKGYICLFICLSTRAIHLEVVEDYSSDAFIAAFSRFTSRRGHCSVLRSDQGTNFVGAEKELQLMFTEASAEFSTISARLAELRTTWKFNPPAAPHFGGIWEAGIKSTKYHLKRIISEHVLTFVEFSTLTCKIEACLNSRPLTSIPDSDLDFEVLTPSHFLIQRSSYIVPEPSRSQVEATYTKRYQWITAMAQQFWKLWKEDYLKTKLERSKWLKTTTNYKVDDVVLIMDNQTPPAEWPLARVIAVYPDDEGVVRKVDVKTAYSTFTRPVVKLILVVKNN